MKFTKRDLMFSLITGLITGFAAWKILVFLGKPELMGFSMAWLMVLVPVLWILGVNLGYFLGRWFGFFNQFGKFAAIGFTNAAVDFGVLNLLIANTGVTAGVWYSVFKATSFISAIVPSYFWNKHWSFSASDGDARETGGVFEFAKFVSVAVVSILVNTGVASFVVNFVDPVLGLDVKVWANVGAVAGSAVALIFSFVGFKLAVFKK